MNDFETSKEGSLGPISAVAHNKKSSITAKFWIHDRSSTAGVTGSDHSMFDTTAFAILHTGRNRVTRRQILAEPLNVPIHVRVWVESLAGLGFQ
jgi:hypothetical protein